MKIKFILLSLIAQVHIFGQKNNTIDSIATNKLNEISIISTNPHKSIGAGVYLNPIKLEKLNQNDINKVLLSVPGVNVRDEEGFGLRPNIGLRGTAVNRSAKITLMEDGILMAPAPYADPSAYYFPTFARMEGIEVLKGSSQIKYGPYTIGGVINLISISIPESFKGFAQISYGSFGTNQQRIWIGNNTKNIDYVFELNRIASNGFKTLDNGNNTGFDRRDMMAKIRWHNNNLKIPQFATLKVLNTTELGNETYLGLTYEDFKTNPYKRYAATQKDKLDLNHHHISINHNINPIKNLNINSTVYYAKTFRDWGRINTIKGLSVSNILANPISNDTAYNIMNGKESGDMTYQNAARTYHSKGIQTNISYKLNSNQFHHNFQIGLRYHKDEADRYATQSSYNMINGIMIKTQMGINGNKENQIREANSFSTYAQYEFSYKNITVNPGIRYENINLNFLNYGNNDYERLGSDLKKAKNNLSILLPGIGINYATNERLSIFASVHKGFSPPGMPSTSSTNGQAKTETALNYEIGFKFNNDFTKTQLVGFMNNYNNILGSDNVSSGGAGTGNMFNAGKATIQGIELSTEFNLMTFINKQSSYNIPLNLAYTFTNAKFNETFVNAGGDWGSGTIQKGDLIPFVTPHVIFISLGFSNKILNCTLISRFVSNTRAKVGRDNTIVPANNINYNDVNSIEKYVVFDFSTNYNFYKNFTVFATLNNIANKKYIVANLPQGYRPGMPFGINVGFKLNLL